MGPMPSQPVRIAIVIASANRPNLLAEAIRTCADQEGVTYRGVVSVPDEDSLPEDRDLLAGWQVVMGTRGRPSNATPPSTSWMDVEVVAFFDDDALLRPDYLANCAGLPRSASRSGRADRTGSAGRGSQGGDTYRSGGRTR